MLTLPIVITAAKPAATRGATGCSGAVRTEVWNMLQPPWKRWMPSAMLATM